MTDVRLTAIADRLYRGRRLADIGSDHAYLPIYAVSHGICPSAVATDVRKGPVTSAREHIEKAGLSDRIEVRLGDGLTVIDRSEAESVVIAGMGGELIAELLTNAPFAFDGDQQWLFQPMSHSEALRRFLLTHGFSLIEDTVISAGKRLYSLIHARYTDAPPETDTARFWIGAVPSDGCDRYWERLTDYLTQCRRGAVLRGESTETVAQWAEWETRVRAYWQEGK